MVKLIETVYNFLWGDLLTAPLPGGGTLPLSLLVILLIPTGVYFTIRTKFLPIRLFKDMVGALFEKKDEEQSALSVIQTLIVSTATRVGMGNLVGVVAAISAGGAGAVFWMWISALLGMCTKFTEVTLAVHFREKNAEGDYVGGPMYYIKNGLGKNWQFLAVLFSAFGVLTVFGTGNATQVNTITTAIDSALLNYNVISQNGVSTLNLIMGIAITVLVGLVLLGGIKRIGKVAEKLVPFMALLYIVLAVGVIVIADDVSIAGFENFVENTDIEIEQLFETDKIMFCHLVDASLDFSDNLAGGRKCIFFVDQKICQIIVPEISGEAVAVCHLDKAVQCLIKLRLICAHILTEPAVLQGNLSIDQFFVGLHQYRHIAQYLPLCEIAVEDTFFYSNHLLSLPSCHFSFYLCEKAAWYGPLFWINNFRKSGISRILPAIRAVRF